jgi:hypothetical protein
MVRCGYLMRSLARIISTPLTVISINPLIFVYPNKARQLYTEDLSTVSHPNNCRTKTTLDNRYRCVGLLRVCSQIS